MKRIGLILVMVVAIVAFGLVVSWTTRFPPAGAEIVDLGKPTAPPDFTLKDLDDHRVSLSQFKGKVVLVNFWTTWCEPCKTEIPWLVDLQDKYAGRGFSVLGIAMDEEGKSAVAAFAQDERFGMSGEPRFINYPIVLGNDATADKFGGVIVFPTSFLISKDGREVKRVDGLMSYDETNKDIQSQLELNEGSAH
jgi:thiol-disulfide isomerase/thioredoxin